MKRIAVLLAAAAAAASLAAGATGATNTELADGKVGQSKTELLAQISYSRAVVGFFTTGRHRWMIAPRHSSCVTVTGSALRSVCVRAREKLRAHRWLASLARARLDALYPPWPPHHQLWLCIHGDEAQDWANHDTGGNGHYGGLQMTPGWNNAFAGTADAYSQMQQEWFAENGYVQHGYSREWLMQQWYHPSCLYAA